MWGGNTEEHDLRQKRIIIGITDVGNCKARLYRVTKGLPTCLPSHLPQGEGPAPLLPLRRPGRREAGTANTSPVLSGTCPGDSARHLGHRRVCGSSGPPPLLLPSSAGAGRGLRTRRQGMQVGSGACWAHPVPCSRPRLQQSCQRAEWAEESEVADSACGGLGEPGSCRNSGSTRSSLRRRPLWSWAPLLCTRFSSSTRPVGRGREAVGAIRRLI